MKKKDLESYVGLEYCQMFRPSQRERINRCLENNNIWYYKQLCRLSEDEFKSLNFVDDNVYTKTVAHLAEYGLRLGMPEEEMLEYMDADFLAEHPEEAAAEIAEEKVVIKESGTGVVSESEVQDDKLNPLDKAESLEQPWFDKAEQPDGHEEPAKQEQPDELADVMEKLAPYAKRLRDEFTGVLIGHHVLAAIMEAYIHQPWWVKMFCGRNERHIRACKETMFVYDTFLKLTEEQPATDEQLSTEHPEE